MENIALCVDDDKFHPQFCAVKTNSFFILMRNLNDGTATNLDDGDNDGLMMCRIKRHIGEVPSAETKK